MMRARRGDRKKSLDFSDDVAVMILQHDPYEAGPVSMSSCTLLRTLV